MPNSIHPMTDTTPELTALAHLLGASYQTQSVMDGQYTYIDKFFVERSSPHGNIQVTISARRGGKGALIGVLFSVTLPLKVTMADIELRAETKTDRVGSALGINREFQSGDPVFDRAVYIESDAPDTTLRRLLSTSVRALAARVVDQSKLSVELHAPPLIAGTVADLQASLMAPTIVSILAPKEVLTNPSIRQLPDFVAALAPAVLQAHQENHTTPDPYGRIASVVDVQSERPLKTRFARGGVVVALVAMSWIGGMIFSGPSPLGSPLLNAQIAVSATLYVLLLVTFVLLLRGRSTSLRNVLIAAVVTIFGSGIAGVAITKHLNAALAPEGTEVVTGLAQVHYGSKGGSSVSVLVDGEYAHLPGSEARRLSATTTGVTVRVMVRTGGIAGRWIESVEPMYP